MAMFEVRKVEAAKALLERAIAVYLDERDYVAAIVLAGAAEDVFRGLLRKLGKIPARDSMVTGTIELHKHLDPGAPALPEKDVVSIMRYPYNWPRHHDSTVDPEALSLDWDEEADHVLARACSDMRDLLNNFPARVDELDARRRTRVLREVPCSEVRVDHWVLHEGISGRVLQIQDHEQARVLVLDPCDGSGYGIQLTCDRSSTLTLVT